MLRSGVERLYSHQALAVDAARAGRDWVVVTGTASGKTLCYNLPVLDHWLRQPQSRAIYLFPTKALARDQAEALRTLIGQVAGSYRQASGATDNPTAPAAQRELMELWGLPSMGLTSTGMNGWSATTTTAP